MMLCKADFEDLFPHLFRPEPEEPAVKPAPLGDGIARQEGDELPRLADGEPLRTEVDRSAHSGDGGVRPDPAVLPVAMIPADAAASTMLSGQGR